MIRKIAPGGIFFFGFVLLAAALSSGEPLRQTGDRDGVSHPVLSVGRSGCLNSGLLWIDTDHQDGSVARKQVAVTADGKGAVASWWLNGERVQYYRIDGTGEPSWVAPLEGTDWFLPLDMDAAGDAMVCATRGNPPDIEPSLYLWTRSSSEPVHHIPAEKDHLWVDAETCDDGSLFIGLAQGPGPDYSGKVFCYESMGGEERWNHQLEAQAFGMACSADGSRLAVLMRNETVILDTTGGLLIDTLEHPAGSQAAPALSGDGSVVVIGTTVGHVAVYDLDGTGRFRLKWNYRIPFTHLPSFVSSVAVSTDGSTVVAGTLDNPGDGEYGGSCLTFHRDHPIPFLFDRTFADQVSEVCVTPDGSRGAAVSYGQQEENRGSVLVVYDLIGETAVYRLADGSVEGLGSALTVDISHQGRTVVFGGKAVHARSGGQGGFVAVVKLPASFLYLLDPRGGETDNLLIGDRLGIRLVDPNTRNGDDGDPEGSGRAELEVLLTGETGGDRETVTLIETVAGSGLYEGWMETGYRWGDTPDLDDGLFECLMDETFRALYVDPGDPGDRSERTGVAIWPLKLVTGPGPMSGNPALGRIYDPFGDVWLPEGFYPYGDAGYGLKIATGDLDGCGEDEIITGPGPGLTYGPLVKVFLPDGTPASGSGFFAYGTWRYGVNVAAGDMDGDGNAEIITGAGPGPVFGPHVRGWDCSAGMTIEAMPGLSYLAYGTHRWGVNVACGDVDGDGIDEIVTGAGPGAVFGAHVRGWNYDGGSTVTCIPQVGYLAYGTHRWGVNVACGDVDGDGIDEIITGAGPGSIFGPHVRGWNYDGGPVTTAIPEVNFFAFPGGYRYGVVVAAGDIDLDGVDEIIAVPGPDINSPCRIRGFDLSGSGLVPLDYCDFTAYDDDFRKGGAVAAGRFR